jgi:long-chain fatty acid transport protein
MAIGKLPTQVQPSCSIKNQIAPMIRPVHLFKISICLSVLLCIIAAENVFANGFGLPDQDAFATARGEAFVATADNPSAIYYNPAGITQLEGNNLRAGIYGINYNPTYQPPKSAPNSGKTYTSSDNYAAIPQFFYTYTPSNCPVSMGLGIYAPYGGNISWPQDTGFRTVAISGSLQYITINPVLAVKLSPEISIGAGIMVNYAKINIEQGLRQFYQDSPNYFKFNADGWSVGYNLGARWQPLEQLSFGSTFRSAALVEVGGQTDYQLDPVIPKTHQSAKADFNFPMTVVSGVSYRPTPKWNLEFDANYTDWSSFGTIDVHQAKEPPRPLKQDVPYNLDWQASWMYEFGVTRYFDHGWQVSCGYVFNESSVPDKYYTPLVADMDRHFFSIGAGRKGKIFDFDVAYQFGYGPTRTVTGSTPSSTPGQFAGQSADGKYSFNSQAIIVSAGLHF